MIDAQQQFLVNYLLTFNCQINRHMILRLKRYQVTDLPTFKLFKILQGDEADESKPLPSSPVPTRFIHRR